MKQPLIVKANTPVPAFHYTLADVAKEIDPLDVMDPWDIEVEKDRRAENARDAQAEMAEPPRRSLIPNFLRWMLPFKKRT
jgi:hypothetical protein